MTPRLWTLLLAGVLLGVVLVGLVEILSETEAGSEEEVVVEVREVLAYKGVRRLTAPMGEQHLSGRYAIAADAGRVFILNTSTGEVFEVVW